MLIGVFWGYVAMMEGLISRLKAEIGRPAKVIATGGLALLFDRQTEIFDAVDTDLTLNGLAILAERAAAQVKKDFTPEDELLFLALGGSGEIGMNVNLYGCRGKWLMVDLGMSFGAAEYPGTELIFADPEFIEERLDDLLGVVLTHAHEDHIGAVPYFAADFGVPLYATPFTAELVRRKLQEAGIEDEIELNVIDREHGSFHFGEFEITYIPLAHSIAEGNALLIETPFGRVFHTGDWKLDDEPLIGVPATEEELTQIGDDGVLAMVCDSTNVFNPLPSGSEGAVYRGLLEEVQRHAGKRVLVTTFASNVARLQTLGRVAQQTGRELCVAGRSLDRMIEVAQANGYLQDFPEPVDFDTAMALPRGKIMILATADRVSRARRSPASPRTSIRSALPKATLCCFRAARFPAMRSRSARSRICSPSTACRWSPTGRA
jgi:mRNA degradation ribonuclease J1/J2